jgi:c-di-GMP-binding flagellar brake protein YcgR
MDKLFITQDNKATLACPACERSRLIDASPYMALSRVVRIRVKCPCGHAYTAQLERRRFFRKSVQLQGEYSQVPGGRHVGKGSLAILDLSRTGLKMRLGDDKALRIGDRIVVEFQLDDRKRAKVRQETVVRRIDGADLGAEFTSTDPTDPNTKAIGFYLFAA